MPRSTTKRKPAPLPEKEISPLILYLFGTIATFLLFLAPFLYKYGFKYDSLYWAFIWGFVTPWACCVAWLWLKIKRSIANYVIGYIGLIVYCPLMLIFCMIARIFGYQCHFSPELEGEY